MKLCLQLQAGSFFCDRWPDDLTQTIGRLVLSPWKTIYSQTTDIIHFGKITAVFTTGHCAKIQFSTDISCGSIIAPVSECFLVPLDAEVLP